MKPHSTTDKVIQYFQNPEILYYDWYKSYYSSELFPGQPVAIIPNIEHIKQSFENWLSKKRNELYNLICVEWDYCNKRKKYSDDIDLASSIADFLISSTINVSFPIALAVLLVQRGLDRFCESGL